MAEKVDGAVVYKLKVPIVIGEIVTDTLRFKQPKLKQMRALDGIQGEHNMFAKMIEKLTGLDRELVDEIDISDFEGIGEIIKNFTQKSQQT